MISDNFQHYKPHWEKGKATDETDLKNVVALCHAKGVKCLHTIMNYEL